MKKFAMVLVVLSAMIVIVNCAKKEEVVQELAPVVETAAVDAAVDAVDSAAVVAVDAVDAAAEEAVDAVDAAAEKAVDAVK
ncbi:MAG: hypothetical protein A2Y39_00040 [Candidatus Delongbacteria bacterium GWF2_40_14]|nr:MAG: hypothetical protein A2Y39_00040 [Candidatus Delongbacteria bacterium GWF2_40_14]